MIHSPSAFRTAPADDRGVTVAEYGVISALASLTVVAALGTIGDHSVVTLTSAVSNIVFG